MLIAFFVTLLFVRGGGDDVDVYTKEDRKLVQHVVADEERADAVVAVMESTQKIIDGYVERSGNLTKSWRKIDTDRDSERAEFEPLLREADEYPSDTLQAFADSIFEMREQVTAEEWEALHRDGQDGH